ncbi:TPA: AAA family ATPase, partial [Burkholderia vietnamiensis]|nr:AAA family ATPase [Burkholderia vietnamiensis]
MRRLQDLGGRATGDVSFGVAGTTREELAELSRRTEQINEYAESHGTDRLTAATRSRNDKDCPPHDDLTKHWSDRLDDLRMRGALRYRHAKDMKGLPSNVGGASLDAITDQLEAHEAYFTRSAVIQRVALESVGVMSAKEVEKAVDALLASKRFVALDKTDDHGQALYTSQRQIDRELWMDAHSRAGVANQAVRLKAEAVQAAIAEFTAKKGAPSLEQRAAIERVTMGTGTVAIIEGRAGTGKSYTSEAIKRAFELEGYACLGAAIANAAQRKLEAESGMASSSITSLLARLDRGMPLPKRCAIFVDEIGMVDLVLREYTDIAKLHGRIIRLNTEDERHLSHAYAVTVHKSQGQGLAWVGALANARMLDKAAALVAFTRSKQAFRFYAGQMDFKGLAEAFARERLKRNAIDFATRAQRQRLDEKRRERDTDIAQQRSDIGEREAATAMSHRFVTATRALREAWRDRRDRLGREREGRLDAARSPLERLRLAMAHA